MTNLRKHEKRRKSNISMDDYNNHFFNNPNLDNFMADIDENMSTNNIQILETSLGVKSCKVSLRKINNFYRVLKGLYFPG